MKYYLQLFSIFLCYATGVFGQLKVNEFMASNANGVNDEDGDYSDWIEIFNSGTTDLNLQNYYITDNRSKPLQWRFPNTIIPAKGYFFLFASGKDRISDGFTYHTVIDKGDTWSYYVPISDIGDAWKQKGFAATGWSSGPSGFGYGDDDDATIVPNPTKTVYIRKSFNVTDMAKVAKFFFHVDYDDGFVAYINGKEIARGNLGRSGSKVTYNQYADNDSREAEMYQGWPPEEHEINNVSNFLVNGENVISVEVHNASANSSDLTLIPFLTLVYNYNYPDAQISSYLKFPVTYNHTNFKISADGEGVYLFKASGALEDSIGAVSHLSDISYGRQPDGSASLKFFTDPTPNSSNNLASTYTGILTDSVKFSIVGGLLKTATSLVLTSPKSGDKIYYTLNGSEPTVTSLKYSTPIAITKDMVVRARIIRTGYSPGPEVSNTYILGLKHTFPIVCISTDSANLWDYNTGIFAMGPGAAKSFPYKGANFWQDWERPAILEMYEPDGRKVLNQGVGIGVHGAFSRAYNQKTLEVFARKEYGKGEFDYKIFPNRPFDKYESFLVRNGGNTTNYSMLTDGILTTAFESLDLDNQAFRPAVVYINGQYWGIMGLREKINEAYLSQHHEISKSSVNLGYDNSYTSSGDITGYKDLVTYFKNHANISDTDLDYISTQMDIDNYIRWLAAELFIDNNDWPGNNTRYWNNNSEGSKWRWILFDMDASCDLWRDVQDASYNTLSDAFVNNSAIDWPNPPWSTLMLRRLATNTKFTNNFINQYADHMNLTFLPKYTLAVVDSLKAIYKTEMPNHIKRWLANNNSGDNCIPDMAFWENEVKKVRDFLSNRTNFARTHVQQRFGLPGTFNVSVDVAPSSSGTVLLNSIVPPSYPFPGVYFKNVPIKLTAIPKPGYKFVRWEGSVVSTNATIDFSQNTTGTFKAVFQAATASDLKVIINEINYSSVPEKNTGDWVELYNAGSTSVNLGGWTITNVFIANGYTFEPNTILAPGEYLVAARDLKSFRTVNSNSTNSVGDMTVGLKSTGDTVRLFDATSKLVDEVIYKVSAPWPASTVLSGATIGLLKPSLDNGLAANWFVSADIGGTPGRANVFSPGTAVNQTSAINNHISVSPSLFTQSTTIKWIGERGERVAVYVSDLQGRSVKQLYSGISSGAVESVVWQGDNGTGQHLSEGMYIISVVSNNRLVGSTKVILMK